jgi:CHAT domain-containing protein
MGSKTAKFWQKAIAIGLLWSGIWTGPMVSQSIPNAHARTLYEAGIEQFNQEQLPAAIELWQKALAIFEQNGDRRGMGDCLYELGFAYYWLGEYDQAISNYQESLLIAEEFADVQRQGTLWGYLADAYFYAPAYAGRQDLIIFAAEKSLALAEASGDHLRQWFSHYRLGEVRYGLEDYAQALHHYQRAVAVAEILEDLSLQRLALANVGLIHIRQENYRPALEIWQQEYGLRQQLGEMEGAAESLQLLGFAAYWLNDYGQAIDYYQKSLELARVTEQRKTEQLSLAGLGDAYYYVGDYPQAQQFHRDSLAIAEQLEDWQVMATLYNALGTDYYALEQPQEAIAYYEKSLDLAQKLQPRGNTFANALSGLGQIYFEQNQPSQALDYFHQSLEVYRAMGNRYNEGAALSNIGHVYLQQKRYDQAIANFQRRLAISEEIEEIHGQAQALGEIGLTLILQKKYAEAEAPLRASLALSESIREKLKEDQLKVSFFDTQASVYRLLQLVLIKQNRVERALEIAEQGRARAFAELLAQQLDPQDRRINLESPDLETIRATVQREQTTVVQYSLIDEVNQLYIWVIQPDGKIQFRQTDLGELDPLPQVNIGQTVTLAQRAIAGERPQALLANPTPHNPLWQLEQILIEPIADLLPQGPNQAVIFIPQGPLFSVPFPALTNGRGEALIDRYIPRTMPSLQILALTQQLETKFPPQVDSQNSKDHKPDLIVGNPILADSLQQSPYGLGNLPHAEAEAVAIGQLLQTKPWLGKEATLTAIMPQVREARVIHLATHGLLDNFRQGGLPGAIALTPEGKDNGLWTANDIVQLDLQAKLVVLSACDTGRGKITGDGVLGLSRAWLTAGAKSVLVSLWSVPDEPTALLMTNFYQNLAQGKNSATALRDAMVTVRQKYPRPVNWAGFTVMGASETLSVP